MRKYDIACVGEISRDIICTTRRFLDSGTILDHVYTGFGGRGFNVVTFASLFGKKTVIFAPAGKDFREIGGFDYMDRVCVSTEGLVMSDNALTPIAIVQSKKNDLRVSFYEGPLMLASFRTAYKKRILSMLKHTRPRLLFATGSRHGMNAFALENAEGAVRAFMPGHETDYYNGKQLESCLRNTDMLFLNRHEAGIVENTLGASVGSIIRRFKVKTAVVTRGKNGSVIYDKGSAFKVPVCKPKKVVDATGAGDSYAGAFIANYLDTNDPAYSARVASSTASFTIEEVGVQSAMPSRKDVITRAKRNYGKL